MKKLLTLFFLSLAFMTNAMAQEQTGWTKDPTIRETHWFGQYEYLDQSPISFQSRTINWSGNYLESIVIVKNWTNQNPAQSPKTSYYSWLDHQLRFSVDNTGSWTIDGSNNSAYTAASQGQGLKNNTRQNQNFNIHNLKAGDEYTITYYENNGSQATKITDSAVGTATVSIPGQAVIRSVEIKLAEYKASDFKVEEVSGQFVTDLTTSHNNFLRNQGVYDAQFGDLGYRYTFKGPGVLEDKRGAVPYMTMKFGADNDMTFVRALSEVQVNYGDLTETEAEFYTKENGGTPVVAAESDEYIVHSNAGATYDWDAQFFITAPYALSTGQQFKVDFWYKADHNASVSTQTHRTAGDYVYWACIGDLTFTDEWKHFEGTATDVSGDMNGFQTIAFNLNADKDADNTFYFKDIKLSVPERTESISTDALGAASIIHEDNDLNPDHDHLQYRWTFKDNNYGQYNGRFSEAEIRDRFIGKEWSTFTADHTYAAGVDPSSNGQWLLNGQSVGDYTDGATNYIYGDEFPSIWPLCGNFFYFFPEVDGLLQIEYYCEGENETNAFWFKQDAEGNSMYVKDQPKVQHINTRDGNRTSGVNNYSLMVNVEKGGIYYLCSLPTNITHERPIFRLKSYTFIPRFRVAPLYKVVHNSEVNTNKTIGVAEIIGGPYTDLNGGQPGGYGNNEYELTGTFIRNAEPETRVKCLGNVASATAKVEMIDGKQKLSFYNIKFKEGDNVNPGGAVVAHVNNEMGQASFVLTIAYDAADAKWNDSKDTRVAATSDGKEVKHWDFYSGAGDGQDGGWDLGKYGEDDGTRYADNQAAWKAKSKLFKETHKADGLTADWEFDYVDVPNTKEPIFKSIYDMEADNADMIHETAGLVFFTEPNELGIYNENDSPTSAYQDRFIGLMGGGKLIIPRLKADDRVVIKMGAFGNVDGVGESEMEQKAVLTLTNAKDAKGNVISGDYIIGGSIPYDDETSPANTLPHGEYHFMVNETSSSDDTDFAIEVKEANLLKIYSIDIYRNAANDNADILTENEVTSETPELLIAKGDGSKTMDFYLRYRGFEEKSTFGGEATQVRGNLALTSESFTSDETENKVSATFNEGKFGSFRAEMAVKTKDESNTYVTDYAPGNLAIGYIQTQEYPYTWDFTDLEDYAATSITAEEGGLNGNLTDDDFEGWEDASLRNAPENEPGILFANGGQLYAADNMFPESVGIGFKRSEDAPEDAKTLNNTLSIVADEGLVLNATSGYHKLVIPAVTEDAAIYVRATPIEGATLKAACSTDGESEASWDATASAGDDNIYVKKATGEDIELWLNGLAVKKIGISLDAKTLDKQGWATESRGRVIDPDLTWYLTGQNIETIFVTGVDYGEDASKGGTVTMSRVTTPGTEGSKVLCALTDGDAGACILHNTAGSAVNILDGFHLFVPDMHDYGTTDAKKTLSDNTSSILIAQVEEGDIAAEDATNGLTNYILSTTYYKTGKEKVSDGPLAFYRVKEGGAHSKGHNAYLQLETTKVKPQGSGSTATAFGLVFDTGEAVNGINELLINNANEGAYTINGMKMEKMPTQKGVYIVNGKKMVIK